MIVGPRALIRSNRPPDRGASSFPGQPTPDADAAAWFDQVIANGGTVSADRRVIVQQFIAAEKAAGTWALTDDYWVLWGENAPQALTSLKQRRLATAIAAPVFTANSGYAFNGTTQYLNTGFVPTTHAASLSVNSVRLAAYCQNDATAAGGYIAGVFTGSSNLIALRPRTSASIMQGGALFSQGQWTTSNSLGYSAVSRTGSIAGTGMAWKNGVAAPVSVVSGSMGSTVPPHPLFIGVANNTGAPNFGLPAYSVGFVAIGAALSESQELAQYTNIQTFAGIVGAAVDADVDAWETAVVANTGTVSAARKAIVTRFIVAEKMAGTWALTDDYWGLWGENAPQALTSLKQRRLATVVAAPTFTADRGYTLNASTQYLNTGYIPGTHAIAMTGTDMRLAVYERTLATTAVSIGGQNNSTTQNCSLRARQSSAIRGILNGNQVSSVGTPNNLGLISISRPNIPSYRYYQRGLPVEPGSEPAASGTVLPTQPIFIGCDNINGTAGSFRSPSYSVGFACIGASLSPTREMAQSNNVHGWASEIGAQV